MRMAFNLGPIANDSLAPSMAIDRVFNVNLSF